MRPGRRLPRTRNRTLSIMVDPLESALEDIAPPIVVFAGKVDPFNPRADGYDIRVAAVDGWLREWPRVYVRMGPRGSSGISLRSLGPHCYELKIGVEVPAAVRRLIQRASGVYCHSIHCLKDPTARRLVSMRLSRLVLDLHGAVPEEASAADADLFGYLESWAVQEADVLICVSRHMQRHIAAKYSWLQGNYLICPIFESNRRELPPPDARDDTVVYAGGTQPWQQVDRIIAHVSRGLDHYNAVILSRQPEIFIDGFARLGRAADASRLAIRSALPREVWSVYVRSRYGILCREANVVNRVACPTKLVEYLGAGLLPLMGTPEVGDFVDLGMAFAPIEALDAGRLPEGSDLAAMVTHNFDVLIELMAIADAGIRSVVRCFHG